MKADDIWQATFALAPARFAAYVSGSDLDTLDAIARHEYNLELSAALTALLNLVEVGIRNAIHNALTMTYGRSDWYDIPGFLMSQPKSSSDDARRVAAVKNQLRQARKPVVPDQVISSLTFGFWPGLFVRHYDRLVVIPVITTQAFILPASVRNRAAIEQRLRSLYKLRNRIAHHEPIWSRVTLWQEYLDILDTMQWLPPEYTHLRRIRDRFPSIYHGGVHMQRLELARFLDHGGLNAFDPAI